MKRIIAIIACVVLTIPAFARPIATPLTEAAGGGAEQMKDVFVGGWVYNSCCEEWVMVGGTGHLVIRNGNFSTSHINVMGMTGMGENGREYTQKATTTQNLSLAGNGTGATTTFNIKMVSSDGCSFTYHLVALMHLNANGDVVVDKVEENVTCE